MNTIKDANGKVIRKSRNLRLVIEHARKVGVKSAYTLTDGPFKCDLTVRFWDGSVTSLLEFNSFRVCYDFIKARRSWGLTEIFQNQKEFLFENKNYP